MGNQRVSNERKKELEQMDPFQENLLKAVAYAKEYKKQLLLILGSLAVIIIIFSSVLYSFKAAETKAAVMVSQTIDKYATAKDPVNGYSLVENDFSTIFDEYSNTTAGKIAKVKFAKICYNASKYDDALKYYKEALEVFDTDPAMKNLLLSSLGNTCLALDKIDLAKEYFEKINQSKSDILKDEANFNLGLLFETSNPETSKTFYQKIINDHQESLYFPMARNKMNLIN